MAMRYLAHPWFMYQESDLSTNLTDTYRDSLDTLAQQSHHRHSLLRTVAVWTTSTARHYQQHRRQLEFFSVTCQLCVCEHIEHREELPPSKRQCRTRARMLGTRSPRDATPSRKRRKLGVVTLHDPIQRCFPDTFGSMVIALVWPICRPLSATTARSTHNPRPPPIVSDDGYTRHVASYS